MLEKFVNSSDQILPTTGFMGFLLQNWVWIAIAVMVLGYAIDQTLYIIRHRPQDHWMKMYISLRRFLTDKFGIAPAKIDLEDQPFAPVDRPQKKAAPADEGPVIRRAAAVYQPNSAPQENRPSQREMGQPEQPMRPAACNRGLDVDDNGFTQTEKRAQPRVIQFEPLDVEPERGDDDAPVVVRPQNASMKRSGEEPTTIRPSNRSE